MSARVSRERRLLVATLVSAVLVCLSHGAGPVGCSTSVSPVAMQPIHTPLPERDQPDLVLARSTSKGAQEARIERGSQIEIAPSASWSRDHPFEGALAGFDPLRQQVIVASDGEAVGYLRADQIRTLTVIGESPRGGYAGRGALIGGLSGAAIGALVGFGIGGKDYGGACAAVIGVPAALVGMGVGAGVGAGTSPGRLRTQYPIGPRGWQIQVGSGGGPASSAPLPEARSREGRP